jgi:hypothetical protein
MMSATHQYRGTVRGLSIRILMIAVFLSGVGLASVGNADEEWWKEPILLVVLATFELTGVAAVTLSSAYSRVSRRGHAGTWV